MRHANLVGGLAPILGERDAVLESLATAIGDTIIEGLSSIVAVRRSDRKGDRKSFHRDQLSQAGLRFRKTDGIN